MEIKTFHIPYLGQFVDTYLLQTEHYNILIDTGLKSGEDALRPYLSDGRQSIVLLTHGHWDHIGGDALVKSMGGQIWASELDLPWLTDFKLHWQIGFGQFQNDVTVPPERWDTFWGEVGEVVEIDRYLKDGDVLTFDDLTIQVIGLPGHSKGCLGYYVKSLDVLFTGDALMHTGFFGGLAQYYCYADYCKSMEKIVALKPQTVYTAHTQPYFDGTAAVAAAEAIAFANKIKRDVQEYVEQAQHLSLREAVRYVCLKEDKKIGCGACICVLNHLTAIPEAMAQLDVSNYLCGI